MLGLYPYRHMAGRQYVDLGDVGHDDLLKKLAELPERDAVLLPRSLYVRDTDFGQRGRSVALVGNGIVRSHGPEIDAHDIVVRVNAAYNWRREADDDGIRFDWWMGRGGMDMLDPERHLDPGHRPPETSIRDDIARCDRVIPITHNNLEAGFVAHIFSTGRASALYPLVSTPYIFDVFDRDVDLIVDNVFADLVCRKKYHHESTRWGAFWAWDLLFTGIQACVLLALGRPARLSLYGFDFYDNTTYVPWDMHSIPDSRAVVERCKAYCDKVGTEFRLVTA